MGEYSKVLSYYEKALNILQKTLPTNHPDLATTYKNIGEVYRIMGGNARALEIYQKTPCKSSKFGYFLQQHWEHAWQHAQILESTFVL
jgi:tetratricopeptide (TPR) repeat protein